MPKPPRRQFAEDLLPLQHNYLRRVAGHIGDIRHLREMVRADFFPVYDLQRILRLSHNLLGSGTTFGFPAISQTAGEVNGAIQKFLENSDTDPATLNAQKSVILEKLYLFGEACTQVINAQTAGGESKNPSLRLVRAEKIIYLVSDVPGKLVQLSERMTLYGLIPKILQGQDKFSDEMREGFFHALVVYSDDPARDLAIFSVSPRKAIRGEIPFIVISLADTFEARLAAVRAGAHAYVSPETEAAEIIKIIDDIAGRETKPAQKSHILLSDSNGMEANFYAHTLQMAGFEVTVVPSPMRVLDVLATRQVDLFITGLDFPGCTGFELALVARQFASLSHGVLFVADQQEFDGLPAANVSAREENFLIKPFNPSQLVALVKILLDKNPSSKNA